MGEDFLFASSPPLRRSTGPRHELKLSISAEHRHKTRKTKKSFMSKVCAGLDRIRGF
jgi:hypothetical protein